jgi:hypothetical protein
MIRLHSITGSRAGAAPRRDRARRVERADRDRAGDAARRERAAATRSSSLLTPPDTITGIVTAVGERSGRLEVRAREHAVTRDVRVNERGDAPRLESLRHLDHADLAHLEPALYGDASVLGVQADRNRPGKRRAALAHELGVAQRRGAEHDAVDAGFERGFHGAEIAQPRRRAARAAQCRPPR